MLYFPCKKRNNIERFYMKKCGFTLSEVLITLGIIGVIAALTLPGLLTDTEGAKVGPKLAKAVSMFEQGNEALLNEYSVDSIVDSGLFDEDTSAVTYGKALSNHIKISQFTYPEDVEQSATDESTASSCDVGADFSAGAPFISKDGVIYVINYSSDNMATGVPAHKQRIGNVYIDINGYRKPNALGSDIFVFSLWNDGSLRPVGGANWAGDDADGACTWKSACPNDETAGDYRACAGSVFENNLKVMFK